jgi:hypothetical protein
VFSNAFGASFDEHGNLLDEKIQGQIGLLLAALQVLGQKAG